MTRCLAAFALLLTLAAAAPRLAAQEVSVGPIRIAQAWTRVPPQGAKVASGFFTITNTGSEADRLIGGSTPLADALEIHEMTMTDGIMKMRALPQGLELKPGATVVLRPGSYHLMLMGLRSQPSLGETVKGTLVFEKAGKVDIELKVEPMGAAGPKGS